MLIAETIFISYPPAWVPGIVPADPTTPPIVRSSYHRPNPAELGRSRTS